MLVADRPFPGRVVPIARLLRLHNGAIAALGVVGGAWWAVRHGTGTGWNARVAIVGLAAVALTGFANALNDVGDVEIDRVAHPERPLPSGALTAAGAVAAAVVCALVALPLVATVSTALALATVGVLAVMALYTAWLKRWGAPGNLAVAVLASLPFVFGAWAAGDPRAGLPLLGVAMPLHLAREVAKDLDDAPADRSARATLPLVLGTTAARWTSAVCTAIFGVAVALLAGGAIRVWLAFLPAFLCAALAVARLAAGRSGAPRSYKAAMVCAILALFTA